MIDINTMDNVRLGGLGERLAEEHLLRDGMRLLHRNWRCRAGELDLVAEDAGCVVFCEVKTRRGTRFGGPTRAITRLKARRLHRLARLWQKHHGRPAPRRFDVVCVWLSPDSRRAAIAHRRGAL